MSNLPRSTEELSPQIRKRITRHFRQRISFGNGVLSRTRVVLDFALNRAGTLRPDSRTFMALRDTLQDKRHRVWWEQVVAAWVLGWADLTQEQQKEATELLTFRLDSNGRTHALRMVENVLMGSVYTVLWCAFFSIALAVLLSLGLMFGSEPPLVFLLLLIPFNLIVLVALLATPGIPFITIACRIRATRQVRQEVAWALGSLKKAEGVSALLRASLNHRFFQDSTRRALTQTLPLLSYEEHYGTLSSDAVPNLCRLLKHSDRPDIVGGVDWQLLLLDALERVGDARAIDSITHQTVAHRETLLHRPIVCERAAQVLEVLKERAARETEQETLLRGSVAPVLPETLLRSYEGAIETPPEQLLRASNEEKDRE